MCYDDTGVHCSPCVMMVLEYTVHHVFFLLQPNSQKLCVCNVSTHIPVTSLCAIFLALADSL